MLFAKGRLEEIYSDDHIRLGEKLRYLNSMGGGGFGELLQAGSEGVSVDEAAAERPQNLGTVRKIIAGFVIALDCINPAISLPRQVIDFVSGLPSLLTTVSSISFESSGFGFQQKYEARYYTHINDNAGGALLVL